MPLAVPICGFDGNGCPISAFDLYKGYILTACSLFVVIIVSSISLAIYIIRVRIRDRRLQDQLWQIPFAALAKVKTKHPAERSERSIQSGPSTTSSKFTVQSFMHSKHFGLYTYKQARCIVWRHGNNNNGRVELFEQDMAELRAMRVLDHENLNKFHGLSTDGPVVMSVWKFCSRGSIRDVLNNNTLTKDTVFIQSIIWELCEGLHFLHNSPLQWHGNLRSSYCLIDERWQVKISYFGLGSLRRFHELKPNDLLWKAPEQLRLADSKSSEAMLEGSKPADMYTLALIMTEVVNMRPCWEEEESPNAEEVEHQNQREPQQNQRTGGGRRRRNAEEICYLVKKGGLLPLRPSIRPAVAEMNPALLHLIRDCWSENPMERPDTAKVRALLRASRHTSANSNLMDHVFNLLEQYANTLEQEVQERTRELVEEKKKSDVLLYRMLPKQVADRLKLGQSLEPEQYECVTVFFSDVVGFTGISGRLKPLQVVNLMNELYTAFDGIIGEHDVYKVETIGDGYLCVSGLPRRNGNQHAKECADMSLKLIRSLPTFSIPNMAEERIRLRIGLHSGPCVAGVVGLAMPRYCLFGDTVNTASRMESSSSPNKIHISCETQRFLNDHFEGYVMESRGEVIIKGKGVLQTFWLLGHISDSWAAPAASTSKIHNQQAQQQEKQSNQLKAEADNVISSCLRRRNSSARHWDDEHADKGEMYMQYKDRVESATAGGSSKNRGGEITTEGKEKGKDFVQDE